MADSLPPAEKLRSKIRIKNIVVRNALAEFVGTFLLVVSVFSRTKKLHFSMYDKFEYLSLFLVHWHWRHNAKHSVSWYSERPRAG